MELTPEQKQALEQQKAQCIFCKIIKGEMPSKKVYEDEFAIALLDINPAAKGHVLVMPKEHYSIMPLLPPPLFQHLFRATKALSNAVSKAMVATGITIFIANGGAAGQQSPHFMLHIIPRDNQDDLSSFEIKKGNIPEKEQQALHGMLSQRLGIMMANYFRKNPASWHDPSKDAQISSSPLPASYTLPQVLAIIEQNPALKKAIEEDPDAVETMITQHDQLKVIFKDILFDDVLQALLASRKKKNKVQDAMIVKEEKNGEKNKKISNEKNKINHAKNNQKETQTNKKTEQKDQDDEINLDSIIDLL